MTRASASLPRPPWESAAFGIRILIRGAGATLALFHGCLIVSQIARGDLADPGLALRWIVAGGLVAALVTLWRRGESLVGRKAVAVWVLAALLHGPALAGRQMRADGLVSLPGTFVSVLLIGGPAGLTLLLLAALTRRHRPSAPALVAISTHSVPFCLSGGVAGWSCAPRPPPCA
jgi:hypothetical protein